FAFAPVAIARDAKGMAALVRDAQGQIMLIKRHGNRFAGRVLGPAARAAIWPDSGHITLAVVCGEPRFGEVVLDLSDPDSWADAINALNTAHNA
ncbi:MAG TPA: hypothetical protein VLA50_07330, partial [Erythrobacter sp.]|nr:hypothetical protein [Erythrobacter sp.]